MKRFLIKGLVFVAPLILLLSFIEYRLSKIPNGYNVKKHYLERRVSEYEVLITGTSHALMGINPQYLGCEAYNMAYVGQDIYYDTHLVLKYLDQMKNLKLLIFPVSYHSLEYRLINNNINGWRVDFYSRYYGIPKGTGDSVWLDPVNYSFIALYGVDETREYVRKGFNVPLEIKMDENGWGSRGNGSQSSEEKVKRDLAHFHSEMEPSVINENLKLLDDLFDRLKARNISVVLVTTPASEAYTRNLTPERYRRMQEGVEYLSRKHGIEYFNYLFDDRFAATDFQDGHHLNDRGAEKFSRVIREDFVSKYVNR